MNWGIKILIVYVAFIAGILFMVFRSSEQKSDLVTTDYYDKELKYQDKINEMNRVSALSAPVEYLVKNDSLVISFPKDFAGKKLTGEAVLYCPSDENKDVKKDFSLQDQPLLMLLPAVNNRVYELHLSWRDGGVAYYYEQKIFI